MDIYGQKRSLKMSGSLLMKLLRGAAVLLCMVDPAIAWDADPATFRADPQAWVRDNLTPACNYIRLGRPTHSGKPVEQRPT